MDTQKVIINLLSNIGMGKNGYIFSHSYYVDKLNEITEVKFKILQSTPELLVINANDLTLNFTIQNCIIKDVTIS